MFERIGHVGKARVKYRIRAQSRSDTFDGGLVDEIRRQRDCILEIMHGVRTTRGHIKQLACPQLGLPATRGA